MKTVVPILCCLMALSCKQKEADTPPLPERTATPTAAPTPKAPAGPPVAEGPLNLDEARYQKWAAFRKEMNAVIKKGMAENVQTHAGKKDDTVVDAVSNLHGLGKGLQAMSGEIDALRSKYGFTDEEDKRIWNAVAAVSSARLSENPMMSATIESMKKMAASKGPGQEGAAKFLKEQEEREAQQLADAKKRYGDGAVAVLSAHQKELQQMQMDAVGAVFGSKK